MPIPNTEHSRQKAQFYVNWGETTPILKTSCPQSAGGAFPVFSMRDGWSSQTQPPQEQMRGGSPFPPSIPAVIPDTLGARNVLARAAEAAEVIPTYFTSQRLCRALSQRKSTRREQKGSSAHNGLSPAPDNPSKAGSDSCKELFKAERACFFPSKHHRN